MAGIVPDAGVVETRRAIETADRASSTKTEEKAIRRANETTYGLASYFNSRDMAL